MATLKKLTDTDITKRLSKISGWIANGKGTELTKSFEIPTFVTGLAFVARIVVHAEVMHHHPVIELSHDKVKVKLSTHDVKGLTKLDFDLARKIDTLHI